MKSPGPSVETGLLKLRQIYQHKLFFYKWKLPIFAKLDEPLVYDTSVEATEIDEIPCDKPNVAQLNQANSQFKFYYTGDFSYLLSSPVV